MQALNRFRLLVVALAAVGVVALGVNDAVASGISGPAFYVDGVLYRTVGTPTDLTGTGAPDDTYDVIYSFNGLQRSVATVAPGYPGFNGGRWQVHSLTFTNYADAVATYDTNGSGNFDSAAEVSAALEDGAAVDLGVVKMFVCTVNKVPEGA